MLFTSLVFVALLAAVLAAHWATRSQRVRLWALFAGSLVFYSWHHWPSVFILLGSIAANYALGRLLEVRRKPALLAVGVALNLSLLAWFKYARFLFDVIASLLAPFGLALPYPAPAPWLPLGISFFTFQVTAYLVDVYRGEVAAERSPLVFAVFKSFFAQLIAGPIVRAKELLPQLRTARTFDPARAHRGLFLCLAGFFLKAGVADVVAQFSDRAFGAPEAQTTLGAWLGVYAYSAQLFADFWGYSTMAVGLGLLFGIELPVNFRAPYLSARLQEFWRRWHVTLGAWFRDYLYIPLGGNRRRMVRNTLIVMGLAGLWHGAGWTFVLWGLAHGAWLAAERRFLPRAEKPPAGWRRALATVLVFHGVALLWVLFRAPSLAIAGAYYGRLFLPPYNLPSSVPGILAVWLVAFFALHGALTHLLEEPQFATLRVRWQVALTVAMLFVVLAYGGARFDFIYFVF